MHCTEEPSATTAADKYSKEVLMMLLMEEIKVLPPLMQEQTLVKINILLYNAVFSLGAGR